jgi:hypothetical protein
MAPTTTPYLRISDGTTTLNLVDGTNYALERGTWAPMVARRRRSTLGGRQYENVVETIPIIVRGSTAATALANMAALSKMLDQAERWSQDEAVAAVKIAYQPHGSTLAAPLESLVLGRADDSDSFQLPLTFNDVGMIFSIHGLVLRFVRDGAWYGAEESITITHSAHPLVGTGTFSASADLLSPVKVSLEGFPDVTVITDYDVGYLLVASSSSRLKLFDAFLLTAATFTTDADAARKPEGSGVLVYTPVGTTEAVSGQTATIDGAKRYGFVAALRNTSATTEFTVRVGMHGAGSNATAYTRPYLVDTSTTDPRVVLLGVLEAGDPYTPSFTLRVTASAAADTLVVDYLAVIALDDPTSRILAIGPIDANGQVGVSVPMNLVVDPRALTAPNPSVRFVTSSLPTQIWADPDYVRGDGWLLSKGTTIACLACLRNAGASYWRAWDAGLNASMSADFVLTRRILYLSPV